MLRVIGAASLFSKVRDPRLPMPETDDLPPLETCRRAPRRGSAPAPGVRQKTAPPGCASAGRRSIGDRDRHGKSVRHHGISASMGTSPCAPIQSGLSGAVYGKAFERLQLTPPQWPIRPPAAAAACLIAGDVTPNL